MHDSVVCALLGTYTFRQQAASTLQGLDGVHLWHTQISCPA